MTIIDRLNTLDLSNPDQQKEYISIVINDVIKPVQKTDTLVIGVKKAEYFEAGRYDINDALLDKIVELNKQYNVYMPVNRVKDDAEFSQNVLSPKSLSDGKIEKRTLFYIDVDAVCLDADGNEMKGYCSTDEEHQHTLDTADKIIDYLRDFGLKVYLKTDTGNGASLYYIIDLSNDTKELFENILRHLADKFELGNKVDIDTTVGNLGRWTKIPGTWSRNKKEAIGRIQRPSRVLYMDESRPINKATNAFKKLGKLYSEKVEAIQKSVDKNSPRINVGQMLDDHKIKVYKTKKEAYGLIYEVDCPAHPEEHRKDGKLVAFSDGRLYFGCFHDNCEYGGVGNHINEFCSFYGIDLEQYVIQQKSEAEKAREAEIKKARAIEGVARPKAMSILKSGNPAEFILDQFNRLHVGDRCAGIQLLAARCCQFCGNSDGLHPAANGNSGAGKTDAEQSMLHLVPTEGKLVGNISTKALYYLGLKPNTVVFVDDINANNEEFVRLLKTAMNNFQKGTSYDAVYDGKAMRMYIPPRTSIWITNVLADFEDQLSNRLMNVQVDGSSEQDYKVRRKQVEQAKTGDEKYPEDEDIWTCREIFRILQENLVDADGRATKVIVPFADEVSRYVDESNRRNYPIIIDMIRAYAILNFMQRERTSDGKIIAEKADWEIIKPVWNVVKSEQETKLTLSDRKVLDAIKTICEEEPYARSEDIQRMTGLSQSRVSRIINSLLEKVPELTVQDVAETTYEGKHCRFKAYSYRFPYEKALVAGTIIDFGMC